MTDKPSSTHAASSLAVDHLQDLVLEEDQGARRPSSSLVNWLLLVVAFAWTLFQLWVASPVSYSFVSWFNHSWLGEATGWSVGVLTHDQIRAIHLAFALFLGYLAYPAFKSSPRRYVPFMDWVYAILAATAALYIYLYSDELAMRAGRPIDRDIIIAWLGLFLLIEATRRALGLPMVIMAVVCIAYCYFGSSEFIPDALRHKGQSISKLASHMWLTQEGVFGVALDVSANFVFLFVLFGALLDKAGAGTYFIRIAFALLGHLRGGAAKAAVLSSGMTGLISGSSIANVVTTGTFTIPLMKRAGLSAEKAAAIEVAAGVDGQIMPPVMGAAAFLMVEYVGIPYTQVIKHAFLPAILSYAALLYIVHLEAVKQDIKPLILANAASLKVRLMRFGIVASSVLIIAGLVHYGLAILQYLFGAEIAATWKNTLNADGFLIYALLLLVAYFILLRMAAKLPELSNIDNATLTQQESTLNFGEVVRTGLYFILPVVVLMWSLMVERLSAGLSGFWAVTFMMFILLTANPMKAWFRREGELMQKFRRSIRDVCESMVAGGRNMIGIATATAAAGIIVGAISLTGVGNVLTDAIEAISGNSLIILLLLTAVICLLLGTGLPTTANYIVVASLMAHVVQELGVRNGLDVPLIAIHMFVFYFGIMADVTPPVGLAAFAASAISGSEPMRTGLRAFNYSLRTAMLPFFFIFNTELLMIGIDNVWEALWVCCYSMLGMLLVTSVLQNWLIVRSTLVENALVLLAACIIMLPNIFNNLFFPLREQIAITNIDKATIRPVDRETAMIRIFGKGPDDIGDIKPFQFYIPTRGETSVKKIFEDYGLIWEVKGDEILVKATRFGSKADSDGIGFDATIHKVMIPIEQPRKHWVYIPAMLIVLFVVMLQLARRRKQAALAAIGAGI